VTTDFGGSDYGFSVALQPDGKIVVAGYAGGDFALARYNSDGALDTSFGSGGKVTTDFGGSYHPDGFSVALQPDGKIVVAGYAGGDFALARYNSDGALDTSFGSGGKVTTDFGGSDAGYSVALQPDGKIVVAGYAGLDFALARYNSDGALDTSFGTGGKVTTDFSGGRDVGYSVALQPDGKIVVAGYAGVDFALARYNSDGALDTSFGSGGKVTTDFRRFRLWTFRRAPARRQDRVAGYAGVDFALARYSVTTTVEVAIDIKTRQRTELHATRGTEERSLWPS